MCLRCFPHWIVDGGEGAENSETGCVCSNKARTALDSMNFFSIHGLNLPCQREKIRQRENVERITSFFFSLLFFLLRPGSHHVLPPPSASPELLLPEESDLGRCSGWGGPAWDSTPCFFPLIFVFTFPYTCLCKSSRTEVTHLKRRSNF